LDSLDWNQAAAENLDRLELTGSDQLIDRRPRQAAEVVGPRRPNRRADRADDLFRWGCYRRRDSIGSTTESFTLTARR
jgi:hypothetical protein